MTKQSRRNFIKRASAGTAVLTIASGLAAAACAPELQGTNPVSSDQAAPLLSSAELSGLIVAYIRNVETGEISLLAGSREIVYRDKAFVQHLLNATL
ncbi:MAG: twin-arginine translocation signal domain-containing protein [Ktedonobacteraceae bacterium]|nr:twin-arginine translocation signal domain-containing protein [Ktedonobacteraceae bacterium]MBO0792209.1 twin-arginine translocation signal domain-containing protein [Ktedonobacteraceae bacterium]